MRRYWIEKSQIQNELVNFTDDTFHHIFDVCRQQIGHHFEVITEDSKAYLVEVISVQKKSAQARIKEERLITPLPYPHINIALSVSRYSVMDSIVEKMVEMGVKSILPFTSDYSFVRSSKEISANKIDRWHKIVKSATQQCGRGELMSILPIVTFDEILTTINPTSETGCLFAYEGEGQKSISTALLGLKAHLSPSPQNLWVIVGSEGGFSTQEVKKLSTLGLDPVTLGAQILRVETACMTLVSVLKYEFGL